MSGLATAVERVRDRARISVQDLWDHVPAVRELMRHPHLHHADGSRAEEVGADSQKSTVTVAGLPARYITAGPVDGEVMLFLHGSGNQSSSGWQKNIEFFANRGYRVIAPDLPGFGATPKPQKQKITDKCHVEFVVSFLDVLGINGKLSVVGASAGGFTATMFAALEAGRVNALITVSSYDPQTLNDYPMHKLILSHPRLMEYSIWLASRNRHMFHMGYNIYNSMNQKMFPSVIPMSSEEVESKRSTWREIRRETFEYISEHPRQTRDYMKALETIAGSGIRTLLMHGEHDQITFPESSERTAALLGSKFESFATTAHAIQTENADEFNAKILAFLEAGREIKLQEPAPEARRRWYSRVFRRRSSD